MIDRLAISVEKAKIKAIGSRNALNSTSKEKTKRKQEIQTLIIQETLQLQRLNDYHTSLLKREAELNDMIQNLTSLTT